MITLEHISKEFVTSKKYPGLKGAVKGLFSSEKVHKMAVDDISFHIQEGEIVGYIGSNGAGKSTTIKMMTGILTPSSGKCLVNGIDPCRKRKQNAKNIGVVFGQRTQLWWDLPLSESFSVLKEIYGVSDDDFKERMEYLNGILELDEFIHSTVRTLSLGQRMRANRGVVSIPVEGIAVFCLSVLAGAVIYTSIKLFFAALAFWVKDSVAFLQVVYDMAEFAKYPTEIYPRFVRFIITFIVPFAFVAYLPATYFLKGAPFWSTIGIECLIAVVFWIISYTMFTLGSRRYESAGN